MEVKEAPRAAFPVLEAEQLNGLSTKLSGKKVFGAAMHACVIIMKRYYSRTQSWAFILIANK